MSYILNMIIDNDIKKLNKYIQENHFTELFSFNVKSKVILLSFKKGEYIIQEGKKSSYLNYLVDGKVSFIAVSNNGKYVHFGGSQKFSILGEVSLLWDLEPTSSVVALTDVYCLAFDLGLYRIELLNDNVFLRYIAQLLASRVQSLDENMLTYVASDASSRFVSYFIQNTDENGKLLVSLTNVADAIGISYRHLMRILAKFTDHNLIEKKANCYYAVNSNKLADYNQDTYNYFD